MQLSTPWQPSKKDVKWLKDLIGSLKEGGAWCVPQTGMVYRFFQKQNVVLLSFPPTHETDLRNLAVLDTIGMRTVIYPKYMEILEEVCGHKEMLGAAIHMLMLAGIKPEYIDEPAIAAFFNWTPE